MDRQVRGHIKSWRNRGVLKVIEHGGGQGRKPAKYALDLVALRYFVDKQFPTPEVPAPELSGNSAGLAPTVVPASGVRPASPYLPAPELKTGAGTSGVEPQLRSISPPTIVNTGSGTYASSESESDIRTEVARRRRRARVFLQKDEAQKRTEISEENRNAILKLAEVSSPGDIEKQLHKRGVTLEHVYQVLGGRP